MNTVFVPFRSVCSGANLVRRPDTDLFGMRVFWYRVFLRDGWQRLVLKAETRWSPWAVRVWSDQPRRRNWINCLSILQTVVRWHSAHAFRFLSICASLQDHRQWPQFRLRKGWPADKDFIQCWLTKSRESKSFCFPVTFCFETTLGYWNGTFWSLGGRKRG